MIYRGHEIRLENGRYKTFSPIRAHQYGGYLYTGSFNSSEEARSWIRKQERAYAEMKTKGAA